MQKKIITSLLISPMAITAMANINVTGLPVGDWKSAAGAVGSGSLVTGKTVTCPVGTGTVENSFVAPARGAYQIEFSNLSNVLNVIVNGEEKSIKDGWLKFEVKTAGEEVSFKVNPKNASLAFSFEQGDTEIVFDFQKTQDELQASLDALPEITTVLGSANIDFDNKIAGVKTEKDAIQEDINKIVEKNATTDLNTYLRYKLYAVPNDIQADINGLKVTIETLNGEIENANELYDIKNKNEKAYEKALEEHVALSEALKTLTDVYNNAYAYTKTACKYDFDTINDDVKAFRTKLDEDFANRENESKLINFEPEPDYAKILVSINQLASKIKELNAQVKAYNDFSIWYNSSDSGVKAAYDGSIVIIDGLNSTAAWPEETNKPAYPDSLFEDYKKTQLKSIEEQYNIATNAYAGVTIDSTSADIEAAKATIQSAVDEMKKIAQNAKDKVEDQNTLMDEALAKITESENKLAKAKISEQLFEDLNVPLSQQNSYNNAVEKVNDAITAVTENVETKYKALELTEEDYSKDKFADVDAALDALKITIDELELTKLQEAYKAIQAAEDALQNLRATLVKYESDTEVDFPKIFEGNLENFREAIAALNADNYDNTQIISQIGEVESLAETIYSVVNDTKSKIENLTTSLEILSEYAEDKVIISGADYSKTNINKGITDLQTEAENWTDTLADIKGGKYGGQTTYNKAKELQDEIKVDDLNTKLSDLFNSLENNGTKANLTYVESQLKVVETNNDEATVNLEDLKEQLNEIKGNVETAIAETVTWDIAYENNKAVTEKVKTCNSLDNKLNSLLETIDSNIAAQNKYIILKSNLVDVLSAIENAEEYKNNNVSGTDAQNYYAGQIGKPEAEVVRNDDSAPDPSKAETLYAKYNTLVALLDYYLENTSVVAGEETFKLYVETAKNAAEKLKEEMADNENALSYLLNVGQEARTTLNGYLKQLNGTSTDATNYDPQLEAVKDAIVYMTDLLTTKLGEVDSKVFSAYGEGACGNEKSSLDKDYKTIMDDAIKIMNSLNTDYNKLVADYNEEIVGKSGFIIAFNNANTAYFTAIKVFNAYKALDNQGYVAYIAQQPGSKNHEELYQYATELINKNKEGVNAVNKANGNNELLKLEDFKNDYVDVIKDLQDKIEALKNHIIADYNTWGDEYYAQLTGKVKEKIATAKIALENAGLSEEVNTILKKENEAVDDAAKDKADADAVSDNSNYQDMIGYEMNSIAWNLDSYNKDINLNVVADKAWETAYDNAIAQINEWAKKVSNFSITSDDIKEFLDLKDVVREKVESENTTFNEASDKIGVLKGCKDKLQSELDRLKIAFDKCKTINEKNKEQNSLRDQLLADVQKLNDDLENLKKFVTPMGVAANTSYNEIVNAITDVETKIKEFYDGNELTNNEATIQGLIDSATLLINNKYKEVSGAEVELLNGLVNQAKVAYNNARTVSGGELIDENDKINKLAGKVNSLVFTSSDESEVFQKYALEYEDDLSEIIAELQATPGYPKVDGENTLKGILNRLNDLYDKISEEIEEGITGLGDYLPDLDDYNDQYEALKTQLGELKVAYTNAYNLFAQEDNYTQQLRDIEAKVKELKSGVDNAKAEADKAKESNQNADRLNVRQSELAKLLQTVESALGKEGYNVLDKQYLPGTTYQKKLTELATNLEDMLAWIEAQNEKHALTKESEYNSNGVTANTIEFSLQAVMLSGSKTYAALLNGDSNDVATDATAYGKIRAVNDGLETKDVTSSAKKEIEEAVKGLETRVAANATAINDFAVSDFIETSAGYSSISEGNYSEALIEVKGYITEANAIITEASDLLDRIEEYTYVPGAVLGGDEITAADIAQIVTWATMGMTVEEITEKDGSAVAAAADLYDDGEGVIDINDVTIAIQLFLNGQDTQALSPTMRKLARYAAPAIDHSLSMGVASKGEENGVRRFAITLDNTMPIIAGQIDLKLPAGMRVVDVATAERNGNHSVTFRDNGDYTRVLIYSMENAEFDSTTGAIVYIDVEGNGDMKVQQMMVTDSYLQSHILNGANTSFVDSIIENAKEARSRIYNAAGMMFNKLQKGINIIRDSNGNVRKEYNRK